MQTGYVFRIARRIFGILTYYPETRVLCRAIETDSPYEACTLLGQQFAGRFEVANSDESSWGHTIIQAGGGVEVLTDGGN